MAQPVTPYEWRYIFGGGTKHALLHAYDRIALCGLGTQYVIPGSVHWYGTGSQAEYERVAELPECKNCRTVIKRR